MIDTDEYERTTPELEEFEGETLGDTLTNLLTEVKWLRSLIEMVSYDLEWYPDRLNQVKRQLEYNVQKWEKKEMIE